MRTRASRAVPLPPSAHTIARAAHRMPEALAAYVAAGLEAERVSAFAEAGQHFERALEIWDLVEDADERSELGLAGVVSHAAQDALVAGEPHRAVTLGRRALELANGTGDLVSQALAHERLGGYLWAAGDSDAALAAHRDAVRVLPAEPPTPALARVLTAEATSSCCARPPRRRAQAPSAPWRPARAVGERAVEGRVLNTFGATMTMTGDWVGGERTLRDAMRIAEELREEYDTTRAYVNLGVCLDKQGRLDEAAELALEGVRCGRAPRRADPRHVPRRRCILEARTPGPPRRGAGDRRPRAGGRAEGHRRSLGLRRRRASRTAPRPARRRRRAFPRSREQRSRDARFQLDRQHRLRPGRGRALALRSDGAQRIADHALDVVAGSENVLSTARVYTATMRAAAECALRALAVGDTSRAGEAQRGARVTLDRLRTLLAPDRWPEGTAGPEPVACEAVCVAELARGTAAPDPEAWDAAAAHFIALKEPFELGYARWRQGEALIVGGGDRRAATDALREAAGIAAALRAPLLLAESRASPAGARAAGIGARRRARAGPRSTASGSRPASSPSCASWPRVTRPARSARRCSSPRTPPACHVSRILAKLAVRSRVEAAHDRPPPRTRVSRPPAAVAGEIIRRVPARLQPRVAGRASELGRLEAGLARAERGTAAAVFVGGEPGCR